MDEPNDRQEKDKKLPETFVDDEVIEAPSVKEPVDEVKAPAVKAEEKKAEPAEEAPRAEAEPTEAPRPADAPKEEVADAAMDIDVSPADNFEEPVYPPKKRGGSLTPVVVILVAFAIALVGYFSYRNGSDEPVESPPSQQQAQDQPPVSEDEAEIGEAGGLPAKAADAVSFSPTPEAEAEALKPAPKPKKPPVKKDKPAAEKPKPAADEAKPAADAAKAADEAKPAADAAKAADEAKPAADAAKAADEAKPASDAAKAADAAKPASDAAKAADEAKPAADAAKAADEAKPAADAAKPAADAAKPAADAKPAGDAAADKADFVEPADLGQPVQAEASSAEPADKAADEKPLAIADLWVVNISSTTDAAESLRLLNRVSVADVGGQVYFYETTIDGKKHHRIRIGFFPSRAEAEEVGRKVKEQFNLSATPWAVRPTTEEVTTFKK